MPQTVADQALLDAQVEYEIYKRTKARQRQQLARAIRKAVRYHSQTRIARALGCSQTYISKLANE